MVSLFLQGEGMRDLTVRQLEEYLLDLYDNLEQKKGFLLS